MILKAFVIFVLASLSAADVLKRSDCSGDSSLLIAAFNVQQFGQKKMNNMDIAKYLSQIIQRYDLIVIQEIRDQSGKSLDNLCEQVQAPNTPYKCFTSPAFGSTPYYVEQYGYIYRTESVRWKEPFDKDTADSYYRDMKKIYERPPHIVQFVCIKPECGKLTFNTIVVHTKPDATCDRKTVYEISNLTQVYYYTQKKTQVKNAVILGDLNADCPYVRKDDWNNIPLKQDDSFSWLIPDNADTAVGLDPKAYDRIITAGEMTTHAKWTAVCKFTEAWGMNDYKKAMKISDHYPVELCVDSQQHQKRTIEEIYKPNAVCVLKLPMKSEHDTYETMQGWPKLLL